MNDNAVAYTENGTLTNYATGESIDISLLGCLTYFTFYNEPSYIVVNLSERTIDGALLSQLIDAFGFFRELGLTVKFA